MVDVVRGMQEVSVRSSSLHGRGAKMGPLIGIQDERNRSRASVPGKGWILPSGLYKSTYRRGAQFDGRILLEVAGTSASLATRHGFKPDGAPSTCINEWC